MNFKRINPPNKISTKVKAKILKYLSIKSLMGSPNLFIKYETNKNRALLLTVEAKIKRGRLILKAPALIVNNLKGIGVKPAVKIIMKLYSSYKILILEKDSCEKPGTCLKKNSAKVEKVLRSEYHISFPIP